MRPILYDFGIDLPFFGPFNFPSYFTMLALSFCIGMWMSAREAPRLLLDKDRVLDMDLWLVVWAIAGARVLHVIADGHFSDYVNLCVDPTRVPALDALVSICQSDAQCGYDYLCDLTSRKCHPPRDCLATVKVWRGGLAYYGGFVFASGFGLWFARKHRMGMWKVADLSVPWIAFGLALTRIGCFLNGCCHGKPSNLPWAVVFPAGSAVHRAQLEAGIIPPEGDPIAVHPAQLYLAALNLLLFLVIYFVLRPRKRFHGELFAWFLIGKGVFRSLVEVWRDDERGVLWGWLSTSMILSVPLVLLGIVILVRRGQLFTGRETSPPTR
ncbi:MAG: prolipoprotein diacylglyceryl transferase [Deltaproteobacteria bacterium]|nr:prolipoprotein diacylglyceryl transferase [Deltaproteobacteria bacterium]